MKFAYSAILWLLYSSCRLKGFSIFSSGSHFVQPSGTILVILVEGQKRNIYVKLFLNRATGGGDVI